MSYPETNGHYSVLTQPYDMEGYGVGVTSPLALSGGEDKRIKEMKKEKAKAEKVISNIEGRGEDEEDTALEFRARSSAGRLDLGGYIHRRYLDLNGLEDDETDGDLVDEGVLEKRAELQERREERRLAWKRDLTGRANGTIDTWYGCYLLNELADYATNFSYPWSTSFSLFFSFSRTLSCV
jgi:hypothetical protein